MVKAIDHINIVVSELERSVRFYTKLLGFIVTKRAALEGDWIEAIVGLPGVKADCVYLELPGPGPRLELLCYRAPPGVPLPGTADANTLGLRHVALRVGDIDREYARLRVCGSSGRPRPCLQPPSSMLRGASACATSATRTAWFWNSPSTRSEAPSPPNRRQGYASVLRVV